MSTDVEPLITCAMVITEVKKSRAVLVSASCSMHTKKVLEMQLAQLEQVATTVQQGESVVIDSKRPGPVCRVQASALINIHERPDVWYLVDPNIADKLTHVVLFLVLASFSGTTETAR